MTTLQRRLPPTVFLSRHTKCKHALAYGLLSAAQSTASVHFTRLYSGARARASEAEHSFVETSFKSAAVVRSWRPHRTNPNEEKDVIQSISLYIERKRQYRDRDPQKRLSRDDSPSLRAKIVPRFVRRCVDRAQQATRGCGVAGTRLKHAVMCVRALMFSAGDDSCFALFLNVYVSGFPLVRRKRTGVRR